MLTLAFKTLQNLPSTRLGRLLDAVRYLGGTAPLFPFYVMLAVTYRCNLRCSYCYQQSGGERLYPNMTECMALTAERNIHAGLHLKPRIHLIGGEPTVNPAFLDILNVFCQRGYKVSFTTNGVLLDDYLADLRSLKGLCRLVISVNKANLGTLRSTLERLAALAKSPKRVQIGVHCPLDLVCSGDATIPEVVNIVQGTAAQYLSFLHSMDVSCERRAGASRACEQIERYRRNGQRLRIIFFPGVHSDDVEAYYGDPAYPGRQYKCVFPWFVTFVLPNGDVTPCVEMGEAPHVMGNLIHEPLRMIWNNRNYRAFRQRIHQRGTLFPYCFRCCFRQYPARGWRQRPESPRVAVGSVERGR